MLLQATTGSIYQAHQSSSSQGSPASWRVPKSIMLCRRGHRAQKIDAHCYHLSEHQQHCLLCSCASSSHYCATAFELAVTLSNALRA